MPIFLISKFTLDVLMSLDPEPFLAQRQQWSFPSTGLRCALRPSPVLHAAPSSRSCWRYRLPGCAKPRQQPHGTNAHGQPVREPHHGGRNQWLRSQRWPWSQVVQHRRTAHEGQRTQRSNLLGHMMSQPPPTLLTFPVWQQPGASEQEKEAGFLFSFLYFWKSSFCKH